MVDRFAKKGLAPRLLLAILMAASAGLLLTLTSGFTFITDEWDLVLLRPGWGPDSLLEPFHEHIVLAPAIVYKLLQSAFGMESARPMQVAAISAFLAGAGLLFAWLKGRVGEWAALIGAAIVLFLGAAFEDLLWAFQLGYFGSLACGIGALVALDRDDERGDLAASLLLVASLAFSSMAIPFVAGAFVEWLTNPRGRRRRWFVPAVPIALYALWWIGWGREAESDASLSNLPDAPRYVWDAASAGMTSMLGLATGDGSEPDQPHLIWGRISLVALAALGWWRLLRLGRVPRGVMVTGAIALAFFLLAALGQNDLRPPTSSRYQLPAVIFILLVCGELLRGLRIPGPALVVAGAVVLATSLSGIDLLRDQAESRWKPSSIANRVVLGAVTTAGEAARPGYALDLTSVSVPVERYLDEVRASGSPGYSPERIAGMDGAHRGLADRALVDVEGIALSGQDPGPPGSGCRAANAGPGAALELQPGAVSKVINREGRQLAVSLARFGDPPGVPVGSALAGSRAWLTLPRDGSGRPWRVSLDGRGRIVTCG